ncbi:MAG: glycosyltransferase family 4 protein [Chitinophagaceae bacterium]|nr:glycosyltransferase family 4 protein [Chitinophagaceae bacterium]MCW5905303.1 glycosyltransferase family 4 protein [Chitinophagaceae bacterium]
MRIAVISMIRDNWGGSEELWYQMAKIALGKNYEVIHLSYKHPNKHPKMQELEQLGLQRFIRPSYINKSSNKYIALLQLAKHFIKKKLDKSVSKIFALKPDIILYNGTCYSIAKEKKLLSYVENYQGNFYIIAHLNSNFFREINDEEANMVRQAYNQAKKVFFVSNATLATAERHLCTSIKNSEIIRNPVNIHQLELLPYPKNKTINFACVGNLSTVHKGQDIMFEVLALPKWRNEHWILNVYGSGDDEQYLKELAIHVGLHNKIIFHGRVADIKAIWQKNNLLLMPSLMEGMPLAVVEAMLCGRTCLATDVGGNTEWITDNINGFIADAATIKCLDNALTRAWDKQNEWEQMGKAAYEKAMQLYNENAGETLLNKMMN